LARYNTDGSLDTSFGTAGQVTTDFAGIFQRAYSVALQSDGKIVAAGYAFISTTPEDFALARSNSDGTLDTTSGTGGKVDTDFGPYVASGASSVALQSDGKIVAAGYAYPFSGITGFDFALARYNSDGSPDAGFGSGGKLTTDFGNTYDYAAGV